MQIWGGSVRRGLPWLAAVFGLLALVWFGHVYHSMRGDPLGARFDMALWISASVLKLPAIVAFLLLLGNVHFAVYASKPRAVMAFALWTITLATAIVLLALTRNAWAPVLRSETSTFFHQGDSLKFVPEYRAAWQRAWPIGVVASELALAILIAGVQTAVAYRFGKYPFASVLLAGVVTDGFIALYLFWCPWSTWDFDFFIGDHIASAILLDHFPMAVDPILTLTLPLYAALVLAHLVFLKLARSQGKHADTVLPSS